MKKGPFKMKNQNSPAKCWKTHKKVGMKKSPSGRTKNGKVIRVIGKELSGNKLIDLWARRNQEKSQILQAL